MSAAAHPAPHNGAPERCVRELCPVIDPYRAAADVLARGGAGGLLVEVQHLAAHHGPELPTEVEALIAPLAMALAAYAPEGSLPGSLAWRSEPCQPCAGADRVARLSLAEEGRNGA